jgi:Mn-containing catalase
VPAPPPTKPDVRMHGTTGLPETLEKAAGVVQDVLHKE